MANIIRRLREPPFGTETSERNLMAAAAGEIERLRVENARLREALGELADIIDDAYAGICEPNGWKTQLARLLRGKEK